MLRAGARRVWAGRAADLCCRQEPDIRGRSDLEEAKVALYPAPDEAPRCRDFSVKVSGQPVDLYGALTRHGSAPFFAYYDSWGLFDVEVIAHFGPSHSTSFLFLAERCGIVPKAHNNRRITFTMDRP